MFCFYKCDGEIRIDYIDYLDNESFRGSFPHAPLINIRRSDDDVVVIDDHHLAVDVDGMSQRLP